MDFIKTCTTNVQRIENLSTIHYAVLTLDEQDDIWSLSYRQLYNLYCIHEKLIYIFGQTEIETSAENLKETGCIHDENLDIIERLKEAVELNLSLTLGSLKDVYKLDRWRWIQTIEDPQIFQSVLIEVQANYTQAGALLITTSTRLISLTSLRTEMEPTRMIVLSPSGLQATAVEHDDTYLITIPRSISEDAWRHKVSQRLASQGTMVDIDEAWLMLQIGQERSSFSWPRKLCFIHAQDLDEPTTDLCAPCDDDPISFAQHWVASASDRRHMPDAQYTQSGGSHLDDEDTDMTTSPSVLYRPELSNAVGVYPTPPDGMTSQMTTHALAQHDSTTAQTEPGNDTNELFRMQTNDNHMALEPLVRGPSITSSVGLGFQHPITDDLFGEEDSGDEQVEDNDFDFFDTGDEILPVQQHEKLDIHESSSSEEVETQDISMVDTIISPPLLTKLSSEHEHLNNLTEPSEEIKHSNVPQQRAIKPLSPFDIRERLLPPPVPASMITTDINTAETHRRSSFAPVQFNSEFSFGSRLQSNHINTSRAHTLYSNLATLPTRASSSTSADEEYSDASSEQNRICAKPPTLPWQDRKRKRPESSEAGLDWNWTVQGSPHESQGELDPIILLERILQQTDINLFENMNKSDTPDQEQSLEAYYPNGLKDILMIAQLTAEQAITCTTNFGQDIVQEISSLSIYQHKLATLVSDTVSRAFPNAEQLNLNALALSHSMIRPILAKGQPRPVLRAEPAAAFPIYAPYFRFNRAESTIEMLPPSIAFWESLSLGPVHGAKDIHVAYILPEHRSIRDRLLSFHEDFRAVYEGCKLGHVNTTSRSEWLVALPSDYYNNKEFYHSYLDICQDLATHLSEESTVDHGRTFMIVLINPYQHHSSLHALCAWFYRLFQSYRESLQKRSRQAASDICFQVLPLSVFYSPNSVSTLSTSDMARFAREVYDRCPPVSAAKDPSALAIAATPSLVLANALPRRINFQLVPNPPSDLLYEGSELHVAYAQSADGLWITVAWLDVSGANQHSSSFCLRGTTIAEVFAEIWRYTIDIIRSRTVSWRVTIAVVGPVEEAEVRCWRVTMSARPQGMMHASFVILDSMPYLNVHSVSHTDEAVPTMPSGVITPVSTPQASGATFSPDASGQTAPPTPAPTEPSTEMDPDAHLIDLPDETWGILLEPQYNLVHHPSASLLAQGALIKHGSQHDRTLPILSLSLSFALRIRGNAVPIENATAKQGEMLLKEVLVAYRGLILLAKARGLHSTCEDIMPLHILIALRGAEAITGLLSRAECQAVQ